MPVSTYSDLRIEVREAVENCLIWMQAVSTAVEVTKNRAETRNTRVDMGALGKFVDEADAAMRELDTLLEELLAKDIPLDSGEATTALVFYANPKGYTERRGQASAVATDGGAIARTALAALYAETGEAVE